MSDIYEAIWNDPASHVSVTHRNSQGQWIDPQADIHLDEQGRAAGNQVQPRPLFAQVNEAVLAQETFRSCLALLDNYVALEGEEERSPDDTSPHFDLLHAQEVDAFLDAILGTSPMLQARDYANSQLASFLDNSDFRKTVRRIWFSHYTNHFASPETFCSGFEHVFVGEQKSNDGDPETVGGYHFWAKYYLDQRAGKVKYLGHDYTGTVAADGIAETQEASVVMTWKPTVAEGATGGVLKKNPGGFFVGTRPECLIALGTLGLLDIRAKRFANQSGPIDHRRVRLGKALVDLVVYPQYLPGRQIGDHLRSFYPKFRGKAEADNGTGGGGTGGGGTGGGFQLPTQPHNSGPIRILRAVPNPPGNDEKGEWVELRNVTSAQLNLTSWRLFDQEGRPQALQGSLVSGETRRIAITRQTPQAMQLGNAGGWIVLYEDAVRRAAVRYNNAREGVIITFAV